MQYISDVARTGVIYFSNPCVIGDEVVVIGSAGTDNLSVVDVEEKVFFTKVSFELSDVVRAWLSSGEILTFLFGGVREDVKKIPTNDFISY